MKIENGEYEWSHGVRKLHLLAIENDEFFCLFVEEFFVKLIENFL